MNVKKFLAAAFTVGLLSVSTVSFANESVDADLGDDAAIEMEMDAFSHGGGHYGRYVCYARNRRGHQFSATGRNANRAQQRAVENCYDAGSRFCYATGCNYVGH